MTALIAALWAYDGWSDLSQLAGEVRDPQRSLPLAFIGGVGIVAALYILIQTAIQYILPAALIAVSDRPAADALRVVAGNAGSALVTIGMAISICATLVGSSLSGARVPFAAARDRLFPRSLAAHPSALPHTLREPHPAGRPQLASAPRHRQIPGALLARHRLRVALLRAHRVHRLHLPPPRPRPSLAPTASMATPSHPRFSSSPRS